MTNPTVKIPDRYQGFPGKALGGITGGLLARRVGREAEVEFRRPVRTGAAMDVVDTDAGVALMDDGEIAAEARPGTIELNVPGPVSWEAATAASEAYLGHHDHPVPSCFTCGTERRVGDGLRVFAGPVADRPTLAAAWTPHPNLSDDDGRLPLEYAWAAVDCPSIWAVMEAAPADSPDHVVSGQLAVRVDGSIRTGEPHVVMAWPLPTESGTRPTAAAIFDADGEVLVVARHTLVITNWGVPLGISRPEEPE